MVREKLLPFYLSIGVSEERFFDGNPSDLKPYIDANKRIMEIEDQKMWQMGLYVQSAVFTAVQKGLHGNKSNASYLKEPLLQSHKIEEKSKGGKISEAEKEQGRKNLLNMLQLMQANFELSHRDDESESRD